MKSTLIALPWTLAACLLVCGCGSSSQNTAPPVNYTVSLPVARATLAALQNYSVSATTNDPGGVTWSATGGTFSSANTANGVAVTYSAPSAGGSYTLTATNATNATASATITVYVTDLAGVPTYHNDLARDGANTKEYGLTPETVAAATFGKLWSCPTDGAVYTQPLWMPNLTVNGSKHNVVFVATQHDSLYAFDADANPCSVLWTVSLIDTNHGANAEESTVPSGPTGNLVGSGYGDITPEVGVTGTPVIDPATGTLYVVSKSMNSAGNTFYQRLHAIDVTTGSEKFGGPANIGSNITFPGTGDGGTTVTFNPQQQNQRAGLTLLNGVVYVVWSSHEDTLPYYGWAVGFNASNLSVTGILNVTPNVQYGGIWMSGGAPSADDANHLYLLTGNGTFDANSATAPNNDYGDSILQLTPALGISSYFTPSDEVSDFATDADFGSGGSAVAINVNSGPLKHLVVGGGKDGTLYLLNGDAMGGFGDSNALQHFDIGSGIFSTGAFWNNNLYMAPIYGALTSFAFNPTTNLFNPVSTSESTAIYGFPGSTPSVSAAGTSNAVVWALDNSQYCTAQSRACGPAVLHGYDATNLTTELWNSSTLAADAAGNAVKFMVPTVANGKVYFGTRGNNIGGEDNSTSVPGELEVYGLKSN